jgi:hypothetical protein
MHASFLLRSFFNILVLSLIVKHFYYRPKFAGYFISFCLVTLFYVSFRSVLFHFVVFRFVPLCFDRSVLFLFVPVRFVPLCLFSLRYVSFRSVPFCYVSFVPLCSVPFRPGVATHLSQSSNLQ